MEKDPKLLEKDAHSFLSQGNFSGAHNLYKEAALIYRNQGDSKEAALCFASAASCWALKSGEKAFYNAAISYKDAAKEAENSGDLEYASLLYKYAAINYEKDMEFISFSECFYLSKECYRRFLTYSFINPKKINHIMPSKEQSGVRAQAKRALLCLVTTLSCLIWGYGERPLRTFFSGLMLVCLSAFFYTFGHLARGGVIFKPDFFQAFYFSIITFTTVGYGDITPVGFMKLVVMIEVFCGLFVVPLFIVGLSRKYLRV